MRVLHPKVFPEPLGPRLRAFHTLHCHRTPTDASLRTQLDTAGVPQ